MRADRLLSLVLLLRRRGRMTAAAIARELEVSTRTVLRDVEALSAAGVPVYAERGRTGGFALLAGWTTDLTGLTHDEARALLVAGSRAGASGAALASAMRKVVAALPDGQRDTATRAADRVLLRPDRLLPHRSAVEADDPAVVHLVQQAVFAGNKLRIRYAARGEQARWRTVDPVGMVDAGGHWYLLAVRDGADRTYRLSRVREAQELAEPAQRPVDVDLERAWEERRTRFAQGLSTAPVQLRLRAHRRGDLLRTAVAVDAERPDGEDWLELDLRFGDLAHAEGVLWSLAPDAEALAPPELRERLRARAAATASRYGPA